MSGAGKDRSSAETVRWTEPHSGVDMVAEPALIGIDRGRGDDLTAVAVWHVAWGEIRIEHMLVARTDAVDETVAAAVDGLEAALAERHAALLARMETALADRLIRGPSLAEVLGLEIPGSGPIGPMGPGPLRTMLHENGPVGVVVRGALS